MSEGKPQIYDILRNKRAFSHMPEQMFSKLIQAMKPQRFRKKQVVLKQGEVSSAIYIILKGKFAVRVSGKLIYNLTRTGDIFGEISFITSDVCTADIIAEEESVAEVISTEKLQEIGGMEFYIWLCRVLAEKLTRTSKMVKNN